MNKKKLKKFSLNVMCVFRVAFLGGSQVGKTSIIDQEPDLYKTKYFLVKSRTFFAIFCCFFSQIRIKFK